MESLANSDVPVVLIKGADLDLAMYQKMFPRTMGDIDILVRPADVPKVVNVFQRQGFTQGKLDKDRFEIMPLSDLERAEFEEGSIELAEFSKVVLVPDLLPFKDAIDEGLSYWRMTPLRDAYRLVIGYDVHIHLSLNSIWKMLGPTSAQSTFQRWANASRRALLISRGTWLFAFIANRISTARMS